MFDVPSDEKVEERIKTQISLSDEELENEIISLIKNINNESLTNIIKEFPKRKPTIKIRTLFYIFKEFDEYNEFNVLLDYLDEETDIFNIVNKL